MPATPFGSVLFWFLFSSSSSRPTNSLRRSSFRRSYLTSIIVSPYFCFREMTVPSPGDHTTPLACPTNALERRVEWQADGHRLSQEALNWTQVRTCARRFFKLLNVSESPGLPLETSPLLKGNARWTLLSMGFHFKSSSIAVWYWHETTKSIRRRSYIGVWKTGPAKWSWHHEQFRLGYAQCTVGTVFWLAAEQKVTMRFLC